MQAGAHMSSAVIAVRPDTPLDRAVRLMVENRISGLPVLDAAGHAVGILTEGDLIRRVETGTEGPKPGWFASLFRPGHLAEDYVRSHGRLAAEVMTPDPVTVEESAGLDTVADLMRSRRVKRLPVTRAGVVVGVISRADLVKLLATRLAEVAPPGDDASIEAAIVAELKRQSWVPLRSVSVLVRDGKVGLDGVVFDERQRQAIGVMAENAPGVRGVENRLIVVEPNTGIVMVDPLAEAGTADTKPIP